MADINEVTQSIVNILKKEQQSEQEMNEIRDLSDTLTHLSKEKSENEKKIKDLENELKTLECGKWNCDLELLKIELESWEITYKEAKEVYDSDVKKMELAQQSILGNQKVFYDTVGEFINSYGIRATLNRNFHSSVRGQMAAAMSGTDAIENCTENTDDKSKSKNMIKFRELEDEISKDQILLEDLKMRYTNVQKSNEYLQKEYENGTEFVRLRNALKYSRDKAAMFRFEIEKHKNMSETQENKIFKLGSFEGKFRLATKQRMITDFIKASEASPSVSNLQNSFEYTDDQSSSMNLEDKQYKRDSCHSYKLVEIMGPSNSQDNCEINQNNNTDEGLEAKKEKVFSLKNTNKNFSTKNDIYKEIYLLKERAKISGKPKKNYSLHSRC